MKSHASDLVRIEHALLGLGLGLVPSEAPCCLSIGETGHELVLVWACGFLPNPDDPTSPNRLWITAEQLLKVVETFHDLHAADLDRQDPDAWAPDFVAAAFWRLLSAEAGHNVHLNDCSTCPCFGCNHNRRRCGYPQVPPPAPPARQVQSC